MKDDFKNLEIKNHEQMEKILMESEEKFRLLFEKSTDPILLLDGDTYIDCNEAALRFMGCSNKEQLVGLRPSETLPERQPDGRLSSEKAREFINIALKKGDVRFEWVRRNFEGKDLWIDVSLTVIPIKGRKIMYTVWRDITERKQAERALEIREKELDAKSKNLEEVNAALKVLLKERENDKKELEEKIVSNVKNLIMPYLEKLKRGKLDANHMTYLGIIEENLNDIISPFMQNVGLKYAHLTPTEIDITTLVKNGRSTKEISDLLCISPGTVKFHRNNIRKKLGLIKENVNLRTYLLSLK